MRFVRPSLRPSADRLVVLVACCALAAASTQAVSSAADPEPRSAEPSGAPLGYAHRAAPPKPTTTKVGEGYSREWVEVKFREGSGIRWTGHGLHVALEAAVPGRGADRGDLAAVEAALVDAGRITGRLFTPAEEALDAAALSAYRRSGRPQADLNLYYRIRVLDGRPAALIDRLNELPVVERAFPRPLPAPAPSPDFTPRQGYARPAETNGINADFAWRYPGGRADHVRVHDIEYDWNAQHEDLTTLVTAYVPNGTPSDPFDDRRHGTAVVGQVAGDLNGFGVTGLVPEADVQVTNAYNVQREYDIHNSILVAAQHLGAGDVMLIEQQIAGPSGCGENQVGCVPVEWYLPAYDAIRTAVSLGVHVVEPAGNGHQDLDDPVFGSPFPVGLPDSGAIVVGAAGSGLPGCTPARRRMPFSNHGSRVDLFAWGDCITTTGYGDLYSAEGEDASYTDRFGGTSGAAAIVAGAVAALSSISEARGATLSPAHVRNLLAVTGRSGVDTAVLGRQPNLRSAIPRMLGAVAGNDLFERAAQLRATQSVDSSGSVLQPGEPPHAGNAGGASVWYRYQPPHDGVLRLHTRGSSIDTLLAAYSGRALRALTPRAANDDVSRSDRSSRVALDVRRGASYWIAVDGFDGLTGRITLRADFLRANSVRVKVRNGSRIVVDVGPDRANGGYRFIVKRKVGPRWRQVRTSRTTGPRDRRVLDLRAGRYRVVVPPQAGFAGGVSRIVRLRR